MVVAPFESASELQEAHTSLLEALDRQIGSDTSADNAGAALAQLETEIRQFLERGAATGVYLNEITDRTSCQILLDYWISSLSHTGLEVTGKRLARFDELKLPDLNDKACPYVGLDAFRNQDFFFGREADTQQLLQQIREASLIVVLGASGSGKSSLVMGGVLPALSRPNTEPGLIVVPPFVPGNAVLESVTKAVPLGIPNGGDHLREAVESLRQNPRHLSLMVGGTEAPSTLITIDQFEEVFTLATSADREALVSNLGHLLEAGRGHRVILTVREEFRSRIVELRALSPYLDKAWYSMRPMNYEELKAAVERPAALVNLQFQPGIVDDLVKKVLGQPAALPLLQFTLRRLWEKRDRNRITREVYQKVGDPLNALTANADAFYDRQAPQTQHEIKRILLELVRVDELLEAYRQPVSRSHLMRAGKANTQEVLELLDDNDYVRISRDTTGTDAVVEVKHESLIRNWLRFVAWIDEKRVQRRQRLALTQAAKRWGQNGKPQEGLLTGWQLQEAKEESDLLDIEQEFIQASTEAADDLQHKKEAELARATRAKIVTYSLLVIALIVMLFAFTLYNARNAARSAQQRAEDLLGFLLGEQFLGQVRDVGRSSLLDQVERKVRSYADDPDPKMAFMRALALRNKGDLQRMHGTTQESLTLFEQALAAIESSPEAMDRYRETARTYDRLGETLIEQGHISQALERYTAAARNWGQVTASTEVEVDDCTSLADSLVSAGELKRRMGQATEASKDLDHAFTVITTAPFGNCGPLSPKRGPYPDAKALGVLSRARMLRANILGTKEDYEGAVRLASEAKRMSPASTTAMQQKSSALALFANSKGDTPQHALQDYRLVLAEFDELRRRDPTNRLWEREQAAVQLLIAEGIVRCHQDKDKPCEPIPSLGEAEGTSLKATITLRDLAKSNPSNVSWQRDIGWAQQVRAKVLAAHGREAESLEAFREAERSYRTTFLDHSDADLVWSLGSTLLSQAWALADLKKWPEAKATLQRVVTLFEEFDKERGAQGDKLIVLGYLWNARTEEVKLLRKAEDKKGADLVEQERTRLEQQYNNLYQDLVERNKQEAAKLNDLYIAGVNRGAALYNKEENYTAALREFNTAEGAMRKYIALLPIDFEGYNNLRNIHDWIQLAQEKLGNSKEAAATRNVMVDMASISTLFHPEQDAQPVDDNLRLAKRRVGQAYYDSKRFDEALVFVQQEITAAELSEQKNPRNSQYLSDLSNAHFGHGLVRRGGRKDGWEEAIRIGIIYIRNAADIDRKNPEYLKALGGYQKYLAGELDADGLTDKAQEEYRLALEVYEKAARLSPDDKEIKDAIEDLKARGAR